LVFVLAIVFSLFFGGKTLLNGGVWVAITEKYLFFIIF
jgi:hypothetical protein